MDDLWRHLDPGARTTATILCLGELRGRVAGTEFDVGDIGRLNRYSSDFNRRQPGAFVINWGHL